MAEGEGVEPLHRSAPQFSRLVAGLPSGTLREVAEGIGIEPMRRYSDRGLASQYLTARSTLRDHREGLDEVSGRMGESIPKEAHGAVRTGADT